MFFRQYVSSQFNRKPIPTPSLTNGKKANISRILPPISPRPSKSILAKSRYFNKNQPLNKNNYSYTKSNNHLYAQASKGNIKDIIKIKNTFLKLSFNKIIKIHNITNRKGVKGKLKINMTTKGLYKKQIIILISTNNSKTIISQANIYISNINRLLKDVKSEVSADFICSSNKGVILTTNKVTASSDLIIVERYVKESNNIVTTLCLAQIAT